MTARMQQTPPSTVPFVEYVLRVIEHPPHMFVSKLAACCTTLFLTRSDPHLLRSLCHKWAIRFSMDRQKLIGYIKERSRPANRRPGSRSGSDTTCSASLSSCPSTSDDEDADGGNDNVEDEQPQGMAENSGGTRPRGRAGRTGKRSAKSRGHLKFCDPEKAEEHFLSILNSLVPLYFSWNWHRTDHVIKMNKEHELYIRENVLPICIAVSAEDGVDDDEAVPWLCPPRSFLRGCSEVGLGGSPTTSISQFYAPTHHASHNERAHSTVGVGARFVSDGGSQSVSSHSPRTDNGGNDGPLPQSPTSAESHGLITSSPTSASERCGQLAPWSRHGRAHVPSIPESQASPLRAVGERGAASLTLMTLSNYKAVLTSSPNGTVVVFHAEYSMKSNDVLQIMQDVVQRQLLDPMPTVAVVYTVTEPELSALYEITWIPTIIYTPPTTESAFDAAATKSLRSMESDGAAKTGPHSPSGLVSPIMPIRANPLHDSASHDHNSAGEYAQDHNASATLAASSNGASSRSAAGLASTTGRASLVDPGVNARGVSATTDAATTAAAQLLYGIDLDRRRRHKGSTPIDQPFTTSPNHSARAASTSHLMVPMDVIVATPTSALDSLENTAHESTAGLSTPVDELVSFVEADGHHIYPLNGVTTAAALIEWINSRGMAPPRVKKAKEFITRVSAIRTEQKFKQFRELHSAVVMLRRLQSNDCGTGSSAAQNGPPLFIFLGGGMAAGKSTAAMALAHSPWWRHHKDSSVLVNADEFKVADPLYETQHPDVHARSTRAAENLLVQAVNQGRSIVFDGTMMWKPFVEQVVSMVRNAHTTMYRQGPGYLPEQNIEEYFQASKKRPSPLAAPYKIVLLGITVEPEIAVPRGFLRKFSTGRGVPISTQLKSFKYFSQNFDHYVSLVDRATLYNNNVFVDLSKGELPLVLAETDEEAPHTLRIYDDAAYQLFLKQRTVNTDADNILELYPTTGSPTV